MSAIKRVQEEKKAKKDGSRKFGINRGPSMAADWGKLDPEVLKRVIVAVTRAGGALRFGYTNDFGAYALGIYGDGPEPYTEYFRPTEDVADALAELAQTFYDIAAEKDMPAGK